jgi:hypothetical protein
MKINYMKPSMKELELNAEQDMLTGSDIIVKKNAEAVDDPDAVLSKDNHYNVWE